MSDNETIRVPRELTREMLNGVCMHPDLARSLWSALLKNAPQPAAHRSGSIVLTAVADLVDDGDGGLEPSWILEGGTAELSAGMTLLVADNAPALCHEDGSAEVYTQGEVERLRVDAGQHKIAMDAACGEITALRAQLAEYGGLLREVRDSCALRLYDHQPTAENKALDERIEAALTTSAEPSATGDGVRDARDYAIEHAGYLVDAADQVQADYQAYALAQMLEKEAGDDGDAEHEEAVDSARDELHEGLANLRSMAYEFRKRRAHAGQVASAEMSAPLMRAAGDQPAKAAQEVKP